MSSSVEEVSIVILNYQSYNDTLSLIKNLKKQQGVNCRIVVVDNKSPNDSYKILKRELEQQKEITVLDSQVNGGYSYGNNIGLKYILEHNLPKHVVILNNDVYLSDSFLLHKLMKEYRNLPNAGFIAPVMQVNGSVSHNSAFHLPTFKDHIASSTMFMFQLFGKRLNQTRKVNYKMGETIVTDCLPGSFFLGSIHTFQDIQFFDENVFLFGEEYILGYKVKQLNLKNYLVSSLSYEHKVSKTIDANLNRFRKDGHMAKSKIYFQEKYMKINFFKRVVIYFFELLRQVELFVFSKTIKVFKSKS